MTYTLGIMSDLHGDWVSTHQALALFDSHGVDQIVCAGDLADRGPHADRIVAALQERGILCVKGNHEHSVVTFQARWRAHPRPEALRRVGRIVSDATLEYIRALPDTVRFQVEQTPILLAHGAPWSDVTRMFPDARIGYYRRLVAEYPDDQIIILGHTHQPMQVEVGHLLVLNPGSVFGITSRDSHTCAILRLPERTFDLFDLSTGAQRPLNPLRRVI